MSSKSPDRPHLVLHLDINKTILVDDRVQGLDIPTSCAQILTRAAWGHLRKGEWVWSGAAPTHQAPDRKAILYSDYLRQHVRSRGERHKLRRSFLQPGQAGEGLRPHLEQMLAALRLPQGVREVLAREAWSQEADLDRGYVHLLPGFFRLLEHLDRERPDTTLVFRTYGSDLPSVAAELAAFCEGRHPAWPQVRLDGSQGGRDWRLDLSDPEKFGALHRGGEESRDPEAVELALGTLENPPGRDRPPYPCPYRFFEERAWRMLRGDALWEHLEAHRGQTLGWRDDYAFWARNRFQGHAGKPLRVYTGSGERQDVFWDDNVRAADAHIIDGRDERGRPLPWKKLRRRHVVRVDPWRAVMEEGYLTSLLP